MVLIENDKLAHYPVVLGGRPVAISNAGLGEEAPGVFRRVPKKFATQSAAFEWLKRELECFGGPWRLVGFSLETGITLEFDRAMAKNWDWWGVPPSVGGMALGRELGVWSATRGVSGRDTFLHRLPLRSLGPAVVRALLTAIDKLDQWVSTQDFQAWAGTYEVLRMDRVVGVEDGLVVGSLEGGGGSVIICVTHPHIDYWEGGPRGICNTCRELRSTKCFGRKHPKGSCPMCGAPLPPEPEAA